MDVLLSHVVDVATQLCIAMVPQAEKVRDKFKPLLTYFAKCHSVYNGNAVDEESTRELSRLHHVHKQI